MYFNIKNKKKYIKLLVKPFFYKTGFKYSAINYESTLPQLIINV